MKPAINFIIAISALFFSGCNNPDNQNDSWNLMGGSYVKHGEMIAYNDYWIEGYQDTIDNSLLFLLVYKEQEITDSLKIDALPDSISFDYGTVEFNQQQDRSLLVLYKPDDSLYHYNIINAWRANVHSGKFEPASLNGIRVVSPRAQGID